MQGLFITRTTKTLELEGLTTSQFQTPHFIDRENTKSERAVTAQGHRESHRQSPYWVEPRLPDSQSRALIIK